MILYRQTAAGWIIPLAGKWLLDRTYTHSLHGYWTEAVYIAGRRLLQRITAHTEMKEKKKSTRKHSKKAKAGAAAKFAKASWKKRILQIFGGLVVLGVAVVLVTTIVTAVKVGHINR